MASLNVSIVAYHTSTDELEQALASLASPSVDTVYLIDNGSEERLKRWCSGRKGVVYIQAPNPGYGAGHNIAIRHSISNGKRYHLVMNSDVRFEPSVIDDITGFMDTHDEVGALQPKIINPDGSLQHTCRRLPTPLDVFARRFLPHCLFRSRDSRYLLTDLNPDVQHNIPYHQGSFMFLRTKALSDSGLFDERFFMYPEDIDLTRRIHRHWLTLYYPEVTVIHDHRADSYRSLRMTWIHAVNMVRYFNKWGWWYDRERREFNRHIK